MHQAKKLGEFEMPPAWPLPEPWLLEIGRMTLLWATLEASVNLYIAKLLGFNDQFDARPAIATAHANFKQRQDILSTLCEQLHDQYPVLEDYERVVKMIDAASKSRNKFVHGSLTLDPDTQQVNLARLAARGKLQVTVEAVRLNDIRQVSKKIHSANLALHNLVTGTSYLTLWGVKP